MPGILKISLDPASVQRFQKTLLDYSIASRKDAALVVNRAGMKLAHEAMRQTKFANRADIERLREISAYAIRGKKRLLTKPRAIFAPTDRAMMIYIARMHKLGRNPRGFSSRKAIEAATLRMVAARLSSIKYLLSGWKSAANKLEQLVRSAGDLGSVRRAPIGNRKVTGGGAHLAHIGQGMKATCEIWTNHVPSTKPTATAWASRYAEGVKVLRDGLQASLEPVRRDMLVYIRRKMNERARQFNRIIR